MRNMSLYLKYRPKKIEELDLTEVREFFQQLAKSGKLSHAYLFDGPRGAGKTSSARILAKMVNCESCEQEVCEPCGECESCRLIETGGAVDLVEIDGASNRRIDDIRDLKDRIRLAPTRLKKKVYIIDEVHMLTTEAFNALLKTLEEPPSHALFILATTEFYKLPETIVSRCVRIKFRKATKEEMLRSLKRVVKGEGGEVEDEALALLAESVDGSFRDGVKILEQVLGQGKTVDVAMMRQVLQGNKSDYEAELAGLILKGKLKESIELVRRFDLEGGNFEFLLKQVMKVIKEEILAGYGVGESRLGIKVGKEGIEIIKRIDETLRAFGGVTSEELLVELLLLELLGEERKEESRGEVGSDSGSSQDQGCNGVAKKKVVEVKEEKRVPIQAEVKRVVRKVELGELQTRWQEIRKAAGQHYSLGALLSTARIMGVEEGDKLVIGVRFKFHKQQLETEKFRREVEKLISRVFGFPLLAKFVVVEGDEEMVSEREGGEEELVRVAEEIFLKGGE